LFSPQKNFTAEIAEHAEIKMTKSSGPGCRGKKRHHFLRFPGGHGHEDARGMIFAFSACSSFTLLASSVKNPQKKISISIKRKEALTAEI
jgi:hypothetical protein